MSIEVQTANSTALLKRLSNLFDYDANYTVLFNIFLPSSNPTYDVPWFISGSSGYNGGTTRGSFYDQLRWKSDGDFNAECVDGGGQFLTPNITTAFSSGWNRVAIIRVGMTQVKIRANGETVSSTNESFITDRQATAIEGMFTVGSGDHCPIGTRITNYKAWTAALSDAEIDAEHVTVNVVQQSGFFSQSPMGDEQSLSGNLTQVGSGSAWTAGAGVVAGANDPSVNYTGTPILLSAAMAGALGTSTPGTAVAL